MKQTIKIANLDCAHCAAELEEELSKILGVNEVNVSYVDQKVYLEYEEESALAMAKTCISNFEEVVIVEEEENADGYTLLHLENLHCAACALDLEDEIRKIKGVEEVQVDFLSQTIRLKASEEGVKKTVKKANNFENVRVIDGGRYESKGEPHKKEIVQILLSAFCFLTGLLLLHIFDSVVLDAVAYLLYAVAYLAVGYSVLLSTAKNVVKGKVFDENFLMTVASIGAIVLGQYDEAVAVMLLYQTGELLQAIAVGSSRQSITRLMQLKSERAYVLRNGEYVEVSPEELKVGEQILMKAGEKVPADGILLGEKAVLDTKSLTGESEPKVVSQGAEVLSGSINAGGVFELKVVRPYEDSAVKKILDLVENATAKKANPEKFITKFARYYTPIVCVLALVIALVAPPVSGLLAGEGFVYKDLARWVQTALTFLVISCPCALIISVPLTYFSGIGACARKGILVKGATYLDELANAKTVAFDKTGTLTEGNFTVCGITALKKEDEKLVLELVATVEKESAHPIARAFENVQTLFKATNVEEVSGRGLKAMVDGELVLVGSAKLLTENGVTIEEKSSPYTLVYVAKNGKYLGFVEVGDKIREETKSVIKKLKETGISRTVMLTGDGAERAKKIADEVGVYEVNAELLPDQKLEKAEELKSFGGLVYVGDGVNDAPVMKTADCAVSMGKLGSAVAVEASDLVLIADDLTAIVSARKIAKKTRKIVVQNIVFSVAMKVFFMLLGVMGVLPLWLAVFADVGVMLLAVLNSLRMRLEIK